MTDSERAFIARFTAEHCRPHTEVMAARRRAEERLRMAALFAERLDSASVPLAAGGEAGTSPAVKSPGEEVRFHFAADAKDGEAPAWRAEVAVPPEAGAGTPVAITVRGADGAPVPDAVLKLAGNVLRIEDGVASMPFGDFLSGMEDTDVSLSAPGCDPAPGALTFM